MKVQISRSSFAEIFGFTPESNVAQINLYGTNQDLLCEYIFTEDDELLSTENLEVKELERIYAL